MSTKLQSSGSAVFLSAWRLEELQIKSRTMKDA